MPDSPTARSMARLRKFDWEADRVEQHNTFSGKKKDLFGFIDLLAMKGDVLLGVQATSTSNLNARLKKSLSSPNLRRWLRIPGTRFECWGWAKRGARGQRKTWTLKRVELLLVGDEIEVINYGNQSPN
jgi:hypothetical protein